MELPPRRIAAEDDFEAHAVAWAVFAAVAGALLALDVVCLHTPLGSGRMSFQTAVKMTGFWLATGLLFDVFILGYLGWDASLGYLQGLFLEYMLSFDNLFVFHLVFAYYCTPEALIYRALYFGIAGAIFLRVFFLLVGCAFLNSGLYVVKLLFGVVLIWSGVRTANDLDDEDTADPTNNRCVAWVTKNLPVSDNYEPHGHFFITVAEVECVPPARVSSTDYDDAGAPEVPPQQHDGLVEQGVGHLPRLESFEGSSLLDPSRSGSGHVRAAVRAPLSSEGGEWHRTMSVSDNFEVMRRPARLKRKASLLLLVVIAVWVVDLVFAVDSVASKLASVSDIFLNCSSSAFAMLSIRSLYFVMESLTRTFQMLKYGIAAILILIGLKLVFAGWLDISSGVCFATIMGIIAASIASSYWMPRFRENCENIDLGSGIDPVPEEDEDEDEEEGANGLFKRMPSEALPLPSEQDPRRPTVGVVGAQASADHAEVSMAGSAVPAIDASAATIVAGEGTPGLHTSPRVATASASAACVE